MPDGHESSSDRIAVIGGGLSGLATACWLKDEKLGCRAEIFEASPRLGGVIRTETVGASVIDHGADMFATQPEDLLTLLKRIGAVDRLIQPQQEGRGAMIVHRSRLVDIPAGFVLMRPTRLAPMMRTPLLSPAAKWRIVTERFVREPDHNDDESVAEFVRRRFGQEVLDRLVGPLVAGIYTADVERLSMKSTMRPIFEMTRRHGSLSAATRHRRKAGEDRAESLSSGARYGRFRSFPDGMAGLIEALSRNLDAERIHLNDAVTAIHKEPDGDGYTLTFADRAPARFHQVVIATPSAAAAKMLRPLASAAADTLEQIRSASAAIVVLVVNRRDIAMRRRTFGFVVPNIERRKILAGSFASHKFSGRTADDQVIIRVFVGGMLQPELLEQEDSVLVQMVRDELQTLIGLGGPPLHSQVIRWPHAMPQYEVGHGHRVDAIRASLAGLSGLHLAGNSLDGVGIAPLVAAARRIADDCRRIRRR